MGEHKQLIGGAWVDAANGDSRDIVNPATELAVETVPFGSAADVAAAIDAAAHAFGAWAAMNPYHRASILERAADLIDERAEHYGAITTEESGKPIGEAVAEWRSAPNYLRYAATEATRLGGRIIPARVDGRRIDVTYRPLGVVGVIAAWNFPVYNVNRAVSSALAAGCTAVVRPSEQTPRSAMRYAEALQDAGVPDGVINVVNGAAAEMANAMLDDPRLRKIQFTGSTGVGRSLMNGASRTITRLSLELGGNAPVIVFGDAADLESVAAGGATAKYRNGGQVCIAPQRFIVHRSIVDDFTRVSAAVSSGLTVGDPSNPATAIGPLVTAHHRDRIEALVGQSVGAGATVVTGGTRPDRPGWFFAPTVLADVPPDAAAVTQEIFGPVMPIVPFDDADEALAIANSVEAGLAAFVWTSDLRTAMRVSDELDYGLVGVNDWYPVTPEAPFGGMKQSGLGRESGAEGILEYVEAKTRYFGGLA